MSLNKILATLFYHGTNLSDAQSILKQGFNLTLRKNRGASLGPGAYMTANKSFAMDYVKDVRDWEEKDAALLTLRIKVSNFLDISDPKNWDEDLVSEYGNPTGTINWPKVGRIARRLGYEAVGNPKGTIVVYDLKKIKVIKLEEYLTPKTAILKIAQKNKNFRNQLVTEVSR